METNYAMPIQRNINKKQMDRYETNVGIKYTTYFNDIAICLQGACLMVVVILTSVISFATSYLFSTKL